MSITITPNNIDTSRYLMNSIWKNCERETIARNIVLLCQDQNEWVSFSWDEYIEFCLPRKASQKEETILNALVSEGYLDFSDNKYQPNIRFLGAVAQFTKS